MNCNFGSKERLEEMLRDRLVCGVNYQGIQRKLLSEGDISYTGALAHSQSIDSAEDDAKKQGGSAPLQPVQYTQKGVKFASSHTSPTCYHCGGLHLAPASPHKEKVCRYCKTKGHLDRVCCAKAHALAKSDPPATGPSSDKKPPPKRTHYIQEQPEQEDNSGGNEYSLSAIHDEPCPQFTITLHINNTPLEMEVNTGARESSGRAPTLLHFFWLLFVDARLVDYAFF